MSSQAQPVTHTKAEKAFKSIPKAFTETAERLAEKPAYFVRGEATWEVTSWSEYGQQVRNAAKALLALDVKPGDVVCILSYNRPEWTILDVAAMMIGAIPTGIYWTSAAPEINYILRHSQGRILLAENKCQLKGITEPAENMRHLRKIIRLDGRVENPDQYTWASFMSLGENSPGLEAELDQRLNEIKASDIALQIYTSGTTGLPKAVQISHGAIRAESDALNHAVGPTPADRYISYLPMAHIAEQCATIIQACDTGYPVYYAKSVTSLGEHLPEVRPTVTFGVPRIFEKIHEKIEKQLNQEKGFKGKLIQWALKTSSQWHSATLSGKSAGLVLTTKKKIANRLVLDKIKSKIGLDQMRMLVSGGAPVSRRILDAFTGLDLVIREVYGQSENCGGATINTVEATRLGSVGKPMEGVTIKVAADGEILCKADTNFSGYAHDPAATDETLRNGWLYSGDIGYLDKDGYVFITGRKKEIIITSGGKNISPTLLEHDLMEIPLVEYAVVAGNNQTFLSALLTIESQMAQRFATENNINPEDVLKSDQLRSVVQAGINKVNARHSRVERIRKFEILPTGFSIDTGELTSTLKIKRAKVLSNHTDALDNIYKHDA
ncbi:Long-chain-fatty-acid--CoA ligase FadD15 [Pseudovibrio axinellae]|uniref:Long-chain-fatty-acid--CoA ligase FadD15 n=1 Tax=Pseudovibrio axinellae TaxID=989403 RepID=A0A161X9P8_9HYPH|nr:long-chain fatty acid--CoA ligase [Pseudovibrio axinellae]KZL09428.1 Long-chain-fatty-acid--CoA ligase FadD15 [Pseudovibrio axinellae]SEQ65192.1 long-chain acyl-CoA synthetase [Pseudovibrio axinellae]